MDLREAIKALIEEYHLADYAYDVRGRAVGSQDGFEGNSWDHPKVKRFSEAVSALEDSLKSDRILTRE